LEVLIIIDTPNYARLIMFYINVFILINHILMNYNNNMKIKSGKRNKKKDYGMYYQVWLIDNKE